MTRKRRACKFLLGWLGLLIVGWMLYALVRGLLTIVALDVPVDDWQWYIAIIGLFAGVTLYAVGRRSRRVSSSARNLLLIFLAVLLLWTCLGYNGFGQVETLRSDRVVRIPISFWMFGDFSQLPDSVVRDIRAAGGAIFRPIQEDEFAGARRTAFIAGVNRLAEYGIPIYLAPPATNFLSTPVAAEWIANTRRVADFVQREHLTNVHGLIGDVEPPNGWPLDVLGIDRDRFNQGVAAFQQLSIDLRHQSPDLHLGVTAFWAHFVDTVDGDDDLSIAMRSPLGPPGTWDFINLMTYSSYFPEDWRPYYVYVHERALARLYPLDRTSHLLGLVGEAMPHEPLMGFDELVRDARISRALGVREVVVFQLDGALRVFGEDFVRRLNEAVNGEAVDGLVDVPFSRPVSLLFYFTVVADALLDAVFSRTWLFVIWLGLSGLLARRVTTPRSQSFP